MITDDFFFASKQYHKLISESYSELKEFLGVNQISYAEVDSKKNVFFAFDSIKWAEVFVDKGYFCYNPITVSPDNMHAGFSLQGNVLDVEKIDNEILEDAIIHFKWYNNFVFAHKYKQGGYFTLGFGTDKNNFEVFNKIFNCEQKVKKLIYKTHARLHAMCKEHLNTHRVHLLDFKNPGLVDSQKGIVWHDNVIGDQQIKLLDTL
jgi:hypothetical protein